MKKIIATITAGFFFFISTAQIIVNQNTNSIGRYDVYELTIQHPQSYANNWEDVTVTAVFSGPQTMNIDGFFYNTNVWKVRFAPPQTGNWNYVITFKTLSNTYTVSGSFTCVTSATKGFLQKHPGNPFRLIYPDGTLFNGIGIGDCINDADNNGTPHDNWGFDGDFRLPGQEEGTDTTLSVYMNAYGSKNGAGFNLFRWSVNNCAFNLFNSIHAGGGGNVYGIQQGLWGDTMVQSLRQNNIRLWLTLFSWNTPFPTTNTTQPAEEAAVNRYIKYVVARYGAYTDIWELNNETTVSDRWINFTTTYLRSIDPYNRLISISWPRPSSPFIDIHSPHWYETESEFDSDKRSWEMTANEKSFNKPVIFGEQGGSVSNWDLLSALRMRLRSWTAFFAEGMIIFWNGSWAKDYYPTNGAANIYLGPQERGYIRALQDFTGLADSAVKQMAITPSNPNNVRAYGLQSSKIIMGYFHHYSSHTSDVSTTFNLTLQQAGKIYWIDPADGTIIQSDSIGSGTQTITSPSFRIDLAMYISPGITPPANNLNEGMEIKIYPNPAKKFVIVKILYGNTTSTKKISMYNSLGQKIFSKNNIINDNIRIETAQLSKGLYIIKLEDKEILSGKFIID